MGRLQCVYTDLRGVAVFGSVRRFRGKYFLRGFIHGRLVETLREERYCEEVVARGF